ncbi:exodeoxyribonuclease VII small subunit [Catalinimonas alkaloidigena]|uniref:exodeoxyribonuclease VII small subunit n=1 Tax=Catalinimonas alkaloidigena TaxID=1075417 RepID=UPI002405D701|nr:exodeoxyribonuclease VII small subunit [Catalinimonas alkaloidigena]MDF9797326.1 exodeoxyribonuclease VII small subunit [Catalinimonas alkaloidigena]
MSPKKKSKELKYQEALDELETIVNEVESDSMDVDLLSEKIERALTLINYCRAKLNDTDNKIQKAFDDEETEEY